MADENLALAYPADAVAQAYSGIAGMLNLLCIFDAALLGMMGKGAEPAAALLLRRRKEDAA